MMTLRSENRSDQWLALLLIVCGVFFRVLPHPDNFTPVTAIALFSGVVLPTSLALTVPLLIMMASDLAIGLHPLIWLVWGSFLAVVLIGVWARSGAGAGRVIAGAFGGSVMFFVLTNLGVFLFENMYPKNWDGFVQCYVMALPFFRNTLAGDLLYTFSLFSLFLAAKWSHHLLAAIAKPSAASRPKRWWDG